MQPLQQSPTDVPPVPFSLLSTRFHLVNLVREVAQTVPAGARMLDAGAGDSPYRRLFAHAKYQAADICIREAHGYEQVSFVCDLRRIPVDGSRYDFILCTQVLEHVPEPHNVLAEFHRILKPGGRVLLTQPLYFEEHEVPYDFFRYTQYGLRSLVEAADFVVERIGWVQGYAGTVAHQLNLARHWLPWRPKDFGGGALGLAAAAATLLLRPVLLGLATIYAAADRRHRYVQRGHCMDYYVIVSKRPFQNQGTRS